MIGKAKNKKCKMCGDPSYGRLCLKCYTTKKCPPSKRRVIRKYGKEHYIKKNDNSN